MKVIDIYNYEVYRSEADEVATSRADLVFRIEPESSELLSYWRRYVWHRIAWPL